MSQENVENLRGRSWPAALWAISKLMRFADEVETSGPGQAFGPMIGPTMKTQTDKDLDDLVGDQPETP